VTSKRTLLRVVTPGSPKIPPTVSVDDACSVFMVAVHKARKISLRSKWQAQPPPSCYFLAWFTRSEDGSGMFLRKVGELLPDYMSIRPRRQYASSFYMFSNVSFPLRAIIQKSLFETELPFNMLSQFISVLWNSIDNPVIPLGKKSYWISPHQATGLSLEEPCNLWP
jgi:hypothetical protein